MNDDAMQVSMLGAHRTEAQLRENGCAARVIDFNLYQFNPVEELSDAYHFSFGEDENVMVMYLLEVRKAED